jgi:hypothetical protein
MLGSDKDIVSVVKGKLVPNPYTMTKEKFDDKLKEMSIKFGYDMALAMKRGLVSESVALYKSQHGITKGNTGEFINSSTVSRIKNAQANPDAKILRFAGTNEDGSPEKEMTLSPDEKAMFTEYSTNVLGKKVQEVPSTASVDGQGNVRLIYYKKGTNVTERTEKLTPDQYREALALKYKLTSGLESANTDLIDRVGSPTLNGNLDTYFNNFKSDKEDKQDGKESGKEYKYNGKTYTQKQIEKGAKHYGYSVEEYLKKLGIK